MPASIRTTVYNAPGGSQVGPVLTDQSRADLRRGYQIIALSVHQATTYSWSLVDTPDSVGPAAANPDNFEGTPSTAGLLPPEGATSQTCKFNVDWEGPYLLRLIVDAGLGTESTQFIRLSFLTQFGDLKLPAAGERRDEDGNVPVDAPPDGWAQLQNQNHQRVLAILRRVSTSGRVLYVDANRGRDNSADQSDPNNIVRFPGPDGSFPNETGIRMQAEAFADFDSINDAIAYAMAAPSRGEPAPRQTDPYVIYIQPGYYEEDLNISAHVHLLGQGPAPIVLGLQAGPMAFDMESRTVVVRTANAGGATHTFDPQDGPDTSQVILQNLFLENTANTTTPVLDQRGGLVLLDGTVVYQRGNHVNQGSAMDVIAADPAFAPALVAIRSIIRSDANADDVRWGLRVDAPSALLHMSETFIQAASALSFNNSLYGGPPDDFDPRMLTYRCTIHGMAGYGVRAYGTVNSFEDTDIRGLGDTTRAAVFEPFGAGPNSKNGVVGVVFKNTLVHGDLTFDTSGAVADTAFIPDGLRMTQGEVIFPAAPGDVPDLYEPLGQGISYGYKPDYAPVEAGPGAPPTVPPNAQLGVLNAQDAIDRLTNMVVPLGNIPFFSLESSYNGMASVDPPVIGDGLGRTIVADGGAVQITGANPPMGMDGPELNGGQQVEGVVDIGPIVMDGIGSEINLNPNLFGGGPFISLGRGVWPSVTAGVPRAIASGVIQAGPPVASGRKYNLRLRTIDGDNSGTRVLGSVLMEGGMSLDDGAGGSPSGGSVFVQGGSHLDTAPGDPSRGGGDVWLIPGESLAGVQGMVRVTSTTGGTHTAATLVPAGNFVGGVDGNIYFATQNGIRKVAIGAGDNIGAVQGLINAAIPELEPMIFAGPQLRLATRMTGPTADVYYVGDDQGNALNAALGDYREGSGAVFTPGTFGDFVNMWCPGNNELYVEGAVYAGEAVEPYVNIDADYVIGDNAETIIGVDTNAAAGPVQVTLPPIARNGRIITIKDETGKAAAKNITIITSDGSGIEAGVSPINVNSDVRRLYYGNGTWYSR